MVLAADRTAVCLTEIVLNIHGEVLDTLAPPGMTLEEAFLPTLKSLHERFPKLRIIVWLSCVPF